MDLFGDTFLTADLAEFWVRSRACPACNERLHTVARLSSAPHWLCAGCGRCFALVHGNLHRVDSLTCEGCATRTKSECLSQFGAQFPAFTCGGLPDDATDPPVPG
jgi:hypothetical protein